MQISQRILLTAPASQPQLERKPRFASQEFKVGKEDINFLSRIFNGKSGFEMLRFVYLYRPTTLIKEKLTEYPMSREFMFNKLYGTPSDQDRFDAMLEEFQIQGLFELGPQTVSLTNQGREIAVRLNERRDTFKPLNEALKVANSELGQSGRLLKEKVSVDHDERDISREFHEVVNLRASEALEQMKEYLRENKWKLSKDEIREFQDGIRDYARQITDSLRKLSQEARAAGRTYLTSKQAMAEHRQKTLDTLNQLKAQLIEALN